MNTATRATVQIVARTFIGSSAREAVGTIVLDLEKYAAFTAELAALLARYDYRAGYAIEHAYKPEEKYP